MRDEKRRELERLAKTGDKDSILALAIEDERNDGRAMEFDKNLQKGLRWANRGLSAKITIDAVLERLCHKRRSGHIIGEETGKPMTPTWPVLFLHWMPNKSFVSLTCRRDAHNHFGHVSKPLAWNTYLRAYHPRSYIDRWCLLRQNGLL